MAHVDTAHTIAVSPAGGRVLLSRCWRGSRPLTTVGLGMLLLVPLSLSGLLLDARTIVGDPAWLKPTKFAASTAIYSLTLAWIFSWLTEARRTRRWVGLLTAAVFVLEVAIIALQAWRGTASHFNNATPLDAALFGIMGVGIYTQTAASIWVGVALWRQHFADRALGTALRAGMAITIVGAATGGLMVGPTRAQLDAARDTGRLATVGSHTVGAPDGGPGLPGIGWSLEHGDLRVPHFVGLHAVQALPLLALFLGRRRASSAPELVRVAAASYAALFLLLLGQALRGEALVSPGAFTLAASAAWAILTLVAIALTRTSRSASRRSAVAVA